MLTTYDELGSHQKSMDQNLDTAGFNYIEFVVFQRVIPHATSSFVSGVLQ